MAIRATRKDSRNSNTAQSPQNKEGEKQDGNVFLPEISNIAVEYETFANNTEFKQSNKSKEFVRKQRGQAGFIHKDRIVAARLFSK